MASHDDQISSFVDMTGASAEKVQYTPHCRHLRLLTF